MSANGASELDGEKMQKGRFYRPKQLTARIAKNAENAFEMFFFAILEFPAVDFRFCEILSDQSGNTAIRRYAMTKEHTEQRTNTPDGLRRSAMMKAHAGQRMNRPDGLRRSAMTMRVPPGSLVRIEQHSMVVQTSGEKASGARCVLWPSYTDLNIGATHAIQLDCADGVSRGSSGAPSRVMLASGKEENKCLFWQSCPGST
jgi:hypothetical protein